MGICLCWTRRRRRCPEGCDITVQAVHLFKSYFGGAFDEDSIRNNFVLIYELLDGLSQWRVLILLKRTGVTVIVWTVAVLVFPALW